MARLFGTPVLFFNEDRRLELFVLDVDNTLYQLWQVAPNGPWSGWYNAGNAGYQPQGLCLSSDEKLKLFVGGGDLRYKYQTAINNGWSGWVDLGSPPSPPLGSSIGAPTPVLSTRNDCVYVFATDERGTGLWYVKQVAPKNDNFSGWASLGNPPEAIVVGPPAVGEHDGLLQIFAVGSDSALWSIKQEYVKGNPRGHSIWSPWFSLGIAGPGFNDRPAVSAGEDGRLEVFVFGKDGSLYHIWETNTQGAWSDWYSHGDPGHGLADHPEIADPHDRRLMLFAVSNGEVFYLRQVAINNGWTGWMSLGTPGDGAQPAPAVFVQENELLRLCVTAADGSLWNMVQTDSDNWSNWVSVGQP